jgi:hypothetical protein
MSFHRHYAGEGLEPAAGPPARARRAAVPATPRGRRLRRPRLARRGGIAIAFALLVIAGAATAAVVRPWNDEPRASAANPRAEARILADPVLSELSWLVPGPFGPRHIAQAGPHRSIAFPPGVTYHQAVTRLFVSVTEDGVLPAGARLGPPLPAGKVVRFPASPGAGIALDLQAPFGYDVPSGRVTTPTLTIDAAVPMEEAGRRVSEARRQGRAIPEGGRLYTGRLPACQTIRAGAAAAPACRLAPPPPHPWDGPAGAAQVDVPEVRGLSAGEAAAALARSGLRAYVMPVVTGETARRLEREGTATVPLDLVRDEEAWRKGVAPVALGDGEDAAIGEVLDAYPSAGAPVRAGSRVVVAAVGDDCLTERDDAYLQATCVPGAEAARETSDELRLAPWLYSHRTPTSSGPFSIASARERPSLEFSPGVRRPEALRRLYVAAVLHGRLPAGARLAPPLPAGIVYRPATAGEGVRIDLRAPFGYARAGHIYAPGLSYRADLRQDQIEEQVRDGRLVLLPTPLEDQVLPIPALAPCQIDDPGPRAGTCPAAR